MRVLLLGSGGRESALAWALDRSRGVGELVAAPGNAGISAFATVVPVDPEDKVQVLDLALKLGPELVVVGPEAPLVAGIGDALRASGFLVFGPDAGAAHIEGSKAYAKELMSKAGIATARSRAFDLVPEAVAFLDELGAPYVVKADGLAAGKGVVVTEDRREAIAAVEECIAGGRFGDAGRRIVVEEFLDGEEVSLIALTDGEAVVACEPAQDYKRIFDDDRGPNTGGMGSYSPVPSCPSEQVAEITSTVIEPMVRVTADAGAPFSGSLYAGLALTSSGPKVLEFNARFGDPETQALIPRLRSDFAQVLLACAGGELAGTTLDWDPRRCVSVVVASGGYPGEHSTGLVVHGLDKAAAADDVFLFHAATKRSGGDLVTSGGRVLAVSALGDSYSDARRRAYEAADLIEFEGKHMRRDIALRAELSEEATS